MRPPARILRMERDLRDRFGGIDRLYGSGALARLSACRVAVGPFDVASFPRGYGEENDFCMRAASAGFRNVLCPNAYVAHEGGVSFSEATQALMKEGAARLLAKHPAYDAEVAAWIAADPVRPRREAIAAVLGAR